MNIVWSSDGSAAKIFGDHSFQPVIVKSELVDLFDGDCEELFHAYHRLYKQNALPYAGSESHPVSLRCWNLALDNAERGEKYWKWGQHMEGCWQYTGLHYIENGYASYPEFVPNDSVETISVWERVKINQVEIEEAS